MDNRIVEDMWRFRNMAREYINCNEDSNLILEKCQPFVDSCLSHFSSGLFSIIKTSFPDSVGTDVQILKNRYNLSDTLMNMSQLITDINVKNLYSEGSDIIRGYAYHFEVYKIYSKKRKHFNNYEYFLKATLDKLKKIPTVKRGSIAKEVILFLKFY